MSIARDLARSLKHLERQLGNPVFTWNGGTYACVANTAAFGKNLGLGGLSPEADLVLFTRAEQFPADGQPQPSQRLDHAGRKYRIETVSTIPGRSLLRIACMDANQKLGNGR